VLDLFGPDRLLLGAATSALAAACAIAAFSHAVLSKSDVRAAIGWCGIIVSLPFLGPLAYLLFGINRIQRRAGRLFGPAPHQVRWTPAATTLAGDPESAYGCSGLARFLDGLGLNRQLDGNSVRPLFSGDDAYGAQLAAIDAARTSIALSTYIFDHDPTGLQFADALQRAVSRGVMVRVLVDAVGDRYSFPSMVGHLRRRGVAAAPFNRNRMPWRFPYLNLRNHRKLLVVDGHLAFTGGMNIRHGHRLAENVPAAVQDIHFEVAGPVVGDLQSVFAGDWHFATREFLVGEAWFPPLEPAGEVAARVVEDGPDRNIDRLLWSVMGAIGCAERRVLIVNPYFLPDAGLDRALQVAARRGVEVDILVPEHSNLQLVHRASRASWRWVLEGGCRIWLTPPPFDHSKLLLMDDAWSFVGSANLDPRSLRLNFELNLACQCKVLHQKLAAVVEDKKSRSTEVTLATWWKQPRRERIVDGAVRLLSPYL
jgi:cardiolipin synthase A/B